MLNWLGRITLSASGPLNILSSMSSFIAFSSSFSSSLSSPGSCLIFCFPGLAVTAMPKNNFYEYNPFSTLMLSMWSTWMVKFIIPFLLSLHDHSDIDLHGSDSRLIKVIFVYFQLEPKYKLEALPKWHWMAIEETNLKIAWSSFDPEGLDVVFFVFCHLLLVFPQ